MKKSIFSFAAGIMFCNLQAQNLLVNSDAESLPAGTGWTVLSQGALTCLLIPTNGMVNWTMKPNGTANYPYDHTTGANGGTVFFSGCDTYFTGPFELEQIADVSADSSSIDAGSQLYDFSGFIQTPVTNQTDIGRFVVDYMNSANTVLGAGYRSEWQSNFDGSGTAWQQYTDTRTAPAGTRKVRIKLQAQIHFNQPAINVYFDDITFSKTSIVPVGLISFTGNSDSHAANLQWQLAEPVHFTKIDLEKSTDGAHFNRFASLPASPVGSYKDMSTAEKQYYRLKFTHTDGSSSFSNIVLVKFKQPVSFSVSPNPARDVLNITGISCPGNMSLVNANGSIVHTARVTGSSAALDIARLPAGMYIARYSCNGNVINKKLLVIKP
jgi:Secretion system C-terminal sorting domain